MLVSAAALAAAGLGVPASAADNDETALEEVIVTARMRAESAQDVPVSATVFSSQMIEDAGIKGVGDFIALSPNITVAESQSAGASFISVRGVTQVRNGEPPVAVVIDDVLQINSRQFTRPLFDIQSIEVVRGPQGAIYGRNAIGGAILITTKQPGNEMEGHFQAGIGTGGEYNIQGSVSGALVEDTLLFRLAGNYVDRKGYFDNIVLDRKVDPVEDFTLRGQLIWNASDQLEVTLGGNMTRTTGGGINFHYQAATYGPDGQPIAYDFAFADVDTVDRDFYANNMGDNIRDIDELSLKIKYEGDWGSVMSISSWNHVEEYLGGDQFPYSAASTLNPGPVFPFFDGGQTQYADVEAWSQEFRVASNTDQPLRWMAGFYYLKTDRFISTSTSADMEQGVLRVMREPFFADASNPTLSFFADDNDNTAWALFGNAAYDLSEQIEISAAIRYDEDKREQLVSPLNTGGTPGVTNTASFDKLQPQFSIKYQATDDINLYASWGKGFRSGQFNQNGVGAAAAGAGVNGVEDMVGPEETSSFEIGFKSEFMDGRFRLNGAAFKTSMKGQQYFVFIGAVSAQVLVNVDEVDLQGFELEAVMNLAEGFDAYASLGITDSEIKAYSVNPAAVGNRAPYVPKSTFNIGAQYRTAITDKFGIFARVDYERRGAQFWDPENTTARSAISLLNLRLGLEDPEGKWTLIGSVNNATDEVYNSEWVLGGFDHPGLPRVWRLDLRYNF
jgi:iron complex outermembrane receptor protein